MSGLSTTGSILADFFASYAEKKGSDALVDVFTVGGGVAGAWGAALETLEQHPIEVGAAFTAGLIAATVLGPAVAEAALVEAGAESIVSFLATEGISISAPAVTAALNAFVAASTTYAGEKAYEAINSALKSIVENLGGTDNGNNISFKGTDGLNTVIDLHSGNVYTGIPDHVINTPTPVDVTSIISNSPFLSDLFGLPHTGDSVGSGAGGGIGANSGSGISNSLLNEININPVSPTSEGGVNGVIKDHGLGGGLIHDSSGTALDPNRDYYIHTHDDMWQKIDPYGNKVGEEVPRSAITNPDEGGKIPAKDIPWLHKSENDSDGTGVATGGEADSNFVNVLNDIGDSVSIAIHSIGDLFSGVVGAIGSAFSGLGGMISEGVSAIGSAVGDFLDWIGDLFSGGDSGQDFSAGDSFAAPVIIDLNGDGVNLSNLHDSSVFFDIDGDGYLEKTAWAGKEDGLLVIDLFKDGKVNFAEEINFKLWDSSAKSDMHALRNVFDTNHNFRIAA